MRRGRSNLLASSVILVLVLALVVVVGCAEVVEPKPEPATTVPDPAPDPQAEPEPEPPEVQIFEIGDRVRMQDALITVNSVRLSEGGEWFGPGEDHIYVVIDITVENDADEPMHVSSIMQFDLVDDDGYSMDMTIYVDAKGSVDGELGAGRRMRGEITWEVPVDATGLEVVYTHCIIDRGQAIWMIGDIQDHVE